MKRTELNANYQGDRKLVATIEIPHSRFQHFRKNRIEDVRIFIRRSWQLFREHDGPQLAQREGLRARQVHPQLHTEHNRPSSNP